MSHAASRLRTLLIAVVAAAVSVAGTALLTRSHAQDKAPAAAASASAGKERFFEMRIYIANDGKLDDLHKRFRDHTNKLFVKHGMDLIGYWVPQGDQPKNHVVAALGEDAKNALIYVLAYPSREARDKSWKDFINDPDWKAAYEASHKNGVLVKKVIAQYMAPTDYSPVK